MSVQDKESLLCLCLSTSYPLIYMAASKTYGDGELLIRNTSMTLYLKMRVASRSDDLNDCHKFFGFSSAVAHVHCGVAMRNEHHKPPLVTITCNSAFPLQKPALDDHNDMDSAEAGFITKKNWFSFHWKEKALVGNPTKKIAASTIQAGITMASFIPQFGLYKTYCYLVDSVISRCISMSCKGLSEGTNKAPPKFSLRCFWLHLLLIFSSHLR